MGEGRAARNARDEQQGIVIINAQQDLQKLVQRMYECLHNKVYDEGDKSMLKTLRPIIDLRSLALKVKQKGAAHVLASDGEQFTKVSKQLATNIVDVPDSEIRIQFREFIRRLERHVAQLNKEDLCSIKLIKVFLETERKLYVEMVMHVICVAAASMSVESVIESMVSIYENRNNKFRPISEERAVLEMNIAINGPELPHADSIIQERHQNVLDDKSGYDHILLSEDSWTYFGIQWVGWYLVYNTLPFGWKISPFVYHTTGLLATNFFHSIAISCSLYIDDHHNGQLQVDLHSSAYFQLPTLDERNLAAANSAIFIVAYYLVQLGYFLGLAKSTLIPVKVVPFLGFLSDSALQVFHLIPAKKEKFLLLLRKIVGQSAVSVKTIQRLVGKCVSFSLAVPGAVLFTRAMNTAISKGLRTHRRVKIDQKLRDELNHWFFLETWDDPLPWRDELHIRISLATDASGSGWGVSVFLQETVTTSDYWSDDERAHDIATREALALDKTLLSFSDSLQNVWVDVQVDNMSVATRYSKQKYSLQKGLEKFLDALPVWGIEQYIAIAEQLKINLKSGYLFRPTNQQGAIVNAAFMSSAAEARLRTYLKEMGSDDGETLHGFRSGYAITLALSGVELSEVMDHVGWTQRHRALYYLQLAKVLNPAGASSRLAQVDLSAVTQKWGDTNELRQFVSAFPSLPSQKCPHESEICI
ncbi:LIGHT-DEPENDENT SHORT HYPOCOTYLS 6 [Paramuricea clavata]|uniref:LIGHT-DEPENDENT SHORT HYPOCOTYLS 6 n=1 Tax=Paramuricea clavata TaxID=317549 RepID=A0A7D9HDB6_PARCT|nr:LIGHT-DEPENDENT SHORT HYPOCOTYLS 6 [Paramuricea clavata]